MDLQTVPSSLVTRLWKAALKPHSLKQDRLSTLRRYGPLFLLTCAAPQLVAQGQTETPIAELETIQITGYREGRNLALQQQREAANRLGVVSADRVGQLPVKNIADAVSRLPGVSLIGDDGEGRFVSIRGLNPNLNNVTINGATIASPGIRNLDGRDNVSSATVPLDIMGSSQLASIEVIKTVTPDMDANAWASPETSNIARHRLFACRLRQPQQFELAFSSEQHSDLRSGFGLDPIHPSG